ncbi:MAG: cytochrome c [Burkholderiales bacterium]|nr:cytochrome c [Burkholderiales bacterium]
MRTIKLFVIALATLCVSAAVLANPFPKANPQTGKRIFDETKCGACHNSLMGGDGNKIFTRPEHKVKDAQALLKMVRFCVNQTGAQVFPEDMEHLAAYLNQQFYKFPR